MPSKGDRETKQARAFAEETAFVLLWRLSRHKRDSRRRGDLWESAMTESRIERVRDQRRLMRRIEDPASIRACADEWQSELGELELMMDATPIA